ncbi:MAG TPA: heat shock protein HspQ [Cycloclasticus sp.]|jgi:heat shock protein HspQ|nr:heat shock protein HspQ [Cycloclasticus sp.]HIM08149.1 heat shock protein HspQ [Gammaproteobacteria bacterium]
MTESSSNITKAKYSMGDLVLHKLFNYRGVILDIDADFQMTEEWYETVARSKPPKNEPWYHVLVHNSTHSTYVAEQNLSRDISHEEINHPMIKMVFSQLKNGRYVNDEKFN